MGFDGQGSPCASAHARQPEGGRGRSGLCKEAAAREVREEDSCLPFHAFTGRPVKFSENCSLPATVVVMYSRSARCSRRTNALSPGNW